MSAILHFSGTFQQVAGSLLEIQTKKAERAHSAIPYRTAITNYTGRYVFVDLGANRADTLKVFLGQPDAKFNYTFAAPPDGRFPWNAEIFLFEANVRLLSMSVRSTRTLQILAPYYMISFKPCSGSNWNASMQLAGDRMLSC